jgi:hypothetical protein
MSLAVAHMPITGGSALASLSHRHLEALGPLPVMLINLSIPGRFRDCYCALIPWSSIKIVIVKIGCPASVMTRIDKVWTVPDFLAVHAKQFAGRERVGGGAAPAPTIYVLGRAACCIRIKARLRGNICPGAAVGRREERKRHAYLSAAHTSRLLSVLTGLCH